MGERMTQQAMTQQATDHSTAAVVPQPLPNTTAQDAEDSLEARALELTEALNAEQKDADVAAGAEDLDVMGEAAKLLPKGILPAKDAPPATDAQKERDARLARVAEMERKSVKVSSQIAAKEKEVEAKAADVEAKAADIARREEQLAKLEGVFNDSEALLGYLADKVGAEKVANWLIEQAQPEKRIEVKQKTLATQMEERLKKTEEDIAKRFADLEAREKKMVMQQARSNNETGFKNRVTQVAAEVPIYSRLMEKRPADAINMAHATAEAIASKGGSVTFDDVIREIESQLSEYSEIYSPQPSGSQHNRPEHRTPSAIAKATTLSNRAAAERSSIANEDSDYASESVEQRASRLERVLRAQR